MPCQRKREKFQQEGAGAEEGREAEKTYQMDAVETDLGEIRSQRKVLSG